MEGIQAQRTHLPRRPDPRAAVRRAAVPAVLLASLLLTAGCAVEESDSTSGSSSGSSTPAESLSPSTSSTAQSGTGRDSDGSAEGSAEGSPEASSGEATAAPESSAAPKAGDGSATPGASASPGEPGLPTPEELDSGGLERTAELGAYFSRDEACMAIGSTVDGLRADMDGGLQTSEDLSGAHAAVEQTYRMVPATLRDPFVAVDEALGEDLDALDRPTVLEELEPVQSWMDETCGGEYHSQDEPASEGSAG